MNVAVRLIQVKLYMNDAGDNFKLDLNEIFTKYVSTLKLIWINMRHVYKIIETPVGEMKIAANDIGLTAILWTNDNPQRVPLSILTQDNDNPLLCNAARQLEEYFARKRKEFSLPLDFDGTEFQKKVWRALLDIPFGQTRTYAEIAKQIEADVPVLAITNLLDKAEIEEKIRPYLNK